MERVFICILYEPITYVIILVSGYSVHICPFLFYWIFKINISISDRILRIPQKIHFYNISVLIVFGDNFGWKLFLKIA